MPGTSRRRGTLGIALTSVVLAVTGCGSAHHTAQSTHPTTGGGPTATVPGTASTPQNTAGSAPSGSVAVVGRRTITTATFQHWLRIVLTGTSRGTGSALVLPDYPTFTHCVAQTRKLPQTSAASTQTLRYDCQQVFRDVMPKVMDQLIHTDWAELAGAKAGVTPSAAQVQKTFAAQQRSPQQAAQIRSLAAVGWTRADFLERAKVQLIERALARHGTGAAALTRSYRPETHCATGYAMGDCAGFAPTGA